MAEQESKAGRNGRWWRDYCGGMTMEAIAARDGVDKATVSRAVAQVRDSIPEVKREEIRQEIHDLYRRIMDESLRIAEMLPPPVVAGKDGDPVVDPVTGEFVRDYSGRLTAYKTAADMADRARKMFGVDEAQKVQIESGEEETARRLAAESRAYLEQEGETDGAG